MSSWIVSNQPDQSKSAAAIGLKGAPSDKKAASNTPDKATSQPVQTSSAHTNGKSVIEQRQTARELALQSLFEIDIADHPADDVIYERLAESDPGEAGVQFLCWLVAGVITNKASLDQMIARYAPDWPIDQLAIIDRNILRMSIYELGAHNTNTPPKVVINEAVELAKEFGSDSSPRFVNGVLGAALQDAQRQQYA